MLFWLIFYLFTGAFSLLTEKLMACNSPITTEPNVQTISQPENDVYVLVYSLEVWLYAIYIFISWFRYDRTILEEKVRPFFIVKPAALKSCFLSPWFHCTGQSHSQHLYMYTALKCHHLRWRTSFSNMPVPCLFLLQGNDSNLDAVKVWYVPC